MSIKIGQWHGTSERLERGFGQVDDVSLGEDQDAGLVQSGEL